MRSCQLSSCYRSRGGSRTVQAGFLTLLLRRLHVLLLGICAASLAFGWVESLYFVFGLPGPIFHGEQFIDVVLLPLLFLVGIPWVTISPCCRCCYGRERAPNSGCCCRGCGRCCACTFGWLPRLIDRQSDGALSLALPLLLVAAAAPWPIKASHARAVESLGRRFGYFVWGITNEIH
jgi:hypothetical protein